MYDAAFKLRVIESAENSNNYAAGHQFGVPTTYTRVNDFGQHMDSIFREATYMWERLRRVYTVAQKGFNHVCENECFTIVIDKTLYIVPSRVCLTLLEPAVAKGHSVCK